MKQPALSFPPRLLRPATAEQYVGGPEILAILRSHFHLRPSIQRPRLTAYLREDLDTAINAAHLSQWGGEQTGK